MTKITYLDHSGFAVVTDSAVLVFDYSKDPSDKLKHILRDNPELPVAFFVSHRHHDHFNKAIFDMAQNHRRVFVLSNDIDAEKILTTVPVAWRNAGGEISDLLGNIDVKAYGSTDAGVCYLVTMPDGKTVFHAGDLNYWHWQDESSEKEVRKAYEDYVRILRHIMEEVKSIDIVFFPVDPRQGTDFETGARLFMENINVRYFFPMHFNGDTKSPCLFENYVTDNTTPVCLNQPGESKELDI